MGTSCEYPKMITAHIAVTLTFLFFFFLTVPASPAHTESRGFRAAMIRRRAHTGTGTTAAAINFTQAARDSRRRLEFLATRLSSSASASANNNSTEKAPLKLDDGGGDYVMEFSMGTPPQNLTAIADTGSDLIWAKCGAACASSSSSCTPLGTPLYKPTASSTFAKLPCSDGLCGVLQSGSNAHCGGAGGGECDYKYSYGLSAGDDVYTEGFLGSETFTLGGGGGGDVVTRGVGFGCATASQGFSGEGSGIVGLGRGPLSLVSQLDAGAFMYCLSSDATKSSPLVFGSLATLTGANVQSTPLLSSTTFYAVNLPGITIGSAANLDGPGGVVFDSGTTLTYLADPAYSDALEAFVLQVSGRFVQVDGSKEGYDACYEKPSRNLGDGVPAMVLHFDGGADMALPVQNYFVEVAEGVVCWIVQRSPDARVSIIGNIMQQNYLVLHDVRRSVLSFQPANCDTSQPAGTGNKQTSSGSRLPFLDQFCTVLLCFCIYMYTSVF